MIYRREDMVYHFYAWEAGANDNQLADDCALNRADGTQVLSLINLVIQTKGYTQVTSGERIEIMLKKLVPPEIETRKDILSWLLDHLSCGR